MNTNFRTKARNRASRYGRQACASALKVLFVARDLTEVFSTQFHDRSIELIAATLPIPYRVAKLVNNHSAPDADLDELKKAFLTGSSLNWDDQRGIFTTAAIPSTWNDRLFVNDLETAPPCARSGSAKKSRRQKAKRQKLRRHFLHKPVSGNNQSKFTPAGTSRRTRYSWFRRASHVPTP